MDRARGSPEFRAKHDIFMSCLCGILCAVFVVTFGPQILSSARAVALRRKCGEVDVESRKMLLQIKIGVLSNRMDNFCRAAAAHNVVAFIVAAGVLLNVIVKYPRYMTPIQDYALFLFTSCALLITNRTSVVNSRSLGIWYSVLMLIASIAVASGGEDQTQYLFVESFLIPPRFMFSVAYGGYVLIVVWNFIYSVAFIIGYGSVWHVDFIVLLQNIWQREALICAAVIFGAYVSNEVLKSKVRRELEAKTLNTESSAMTELLGLVCDVVVELDEDLRISSPAPKFAAFATLCSKKDLRGLQFQHFMPMAADGERFERCLRACKCDEGRTQPGAVHVALRDSLGNHMQVEVFFVHYFDVDHCSHYYVGVREFTDVASPMELQHSGRKWRTRPRSRSSAGSTSPHCERRHLSSGGPLPGSETGDDHHDLVAQRDHLGSEESVHSSTMSSVSLRSANARLRGKLRMPRARPTLDPAKDMMLADLVLHWNYRAKMTTCCPWHASMMELRRSLRRLESRACSPHFGAECAKHPVHQCEGCGVLALPDHLYLGDKPVCCPACSGKWVAVANVVGL